MNERLRVLLTRWGLHDWGQETESTLDLDAIRYMSKRVFDDYEPAQFDRFEDRLDRWLHNVEAEEEQRTLFRLLSGLFFIGRPEFESLCRAAYHGPVLRWLVSELNVDIADPAASEFLAAGIKRTWFCPITDSMRINAFLKVNGLTGKSHRPDWRSLKRFGSDDKIRDYVAGENIDRLVLLEDFVGSGTQMRSVINFAATISTELRILACPLVTCPAGDDVGEELARKLNNVSYEAAMKITPSMLIKADPEPKERPLHAQVRDLTKSVSHRLSPTEPDAESRRHHGYRGTGAVVTLYSNCPNNTLPIIWDDTTHWKPLFPRLKRA
jgi:hypothetical protein